MDAIRTRIFGEVNYELDYQETEWGTTSDDTKNAPNDWVTYIAGYATNWRDRSFVPFKKLTVDAFRKSMIKVAATAIAAVASIDRQREAHGRTFYEKTPMAEAAKEA